MGTSFLRSDSDKWGQGLKWGQSESRDNMLFLHHNKSNSELELECKNQGLNEFLKISEDQNSKLEKEIQNVKESRLCKICLDKEVSQVFLPCGHSICCNECVVGIQICPICRDWIQKSQTIYFS